MAHGTEIPLGKAVTYTSEYDAALLFPIPRQAQREQLQLNAGNLPFVGWDIWHAYELSWLNSKGKPVVAVGRFTIPAHSSHLIESKSLKLYLNSFNQTRFSDMAEVQHTITTDLSGVLGADIVVELYPVDALADDPNGTLAVLPGTCIDALDVDCQVYTVDSSLLQVSAEQATEQLYSNLLKSNCLVTGQPDWGTVHIAYTGKRIDPASLLRYIVSFRQHQEFHEHCVERIFTDVLQITAASELTVYARYTRRGGLDICPYRSLSQSRPDFVQRLHRQ